MTFARKLTAVILLLLCLTLSAGGAWTVQQNFAALRTAAEQQAAAQHLRDCFAIETAIEECLLADFAAIAQHNNTKYYKLARYYYGKGFYVHSTTTDHGYIRALFVKELKHTPVDLTPAFAE